MEFGNAPRIVAPTAAPPVTRSDVTAQPGSVAVDLPPEKTVQSASAGAAVNVEVRAQARDAQSRADGERRAFTNDQNGRAANRTVDETVERKLVIDPQTRAIVLQKKDRETGETISQLPDELLLKLRAYSRELSERAREAEEERHLVERTA
ncbi:flagellar protein FlaG [Bosea sp. F3-2]|uniref:flagellar protein FlaG n=1 Tax=Bosea sp. F3-2 TaxID=2599640 RepID=UPI0011EC55E4|nr:flagellar protein FlaG [Bosea sp. F3-2]QEL26283.1 flagellar protein FlaG [Bosea sp. F3-2]